MKKMMILLAGMAGLATSAGAQYIRFAPEIGLNLSNVQVRDSRGNGTDISSGNTKPGLKIGAMVDIGLSPFVSLQPGLFLSQKGYRLSEETTGGIVLTRADAWRRVTLNYLELPLNVMFKVGDPRYPRFFFGAGAYLAYGVGGKVKYGPYAGQSGTTSRDIEYGDNQNNDDYRGVDGGGQLFAGVLMPFGGFFKAQYQAGLANIDPAQDDDYKVRNSTASITMGFMIGPRDRGMRGHHHHGHRPHRRFDD